MNRMNRWGIPSNGEGCIERFVDFELIDKNADQLRFYCYFWGASYERGAPENLFDVVRDCRMELTTIVMKRSRCLLLVTSLENWIETRETFECELCDDVGQFLNLQIGQHERKIWTKDIPALTIRYCTSGFDMEFYYCVDESCIRQARNELNRILAS